MIVIVDRSRSTGLGEALSGKPAFYINVNSQDWHDVEENPDFKRLPPAEQEIIKKKYPIAFERHRIIYSVRF